MNILIAEDDEYDAFLIERALRRAAADRSHIQRVKDGYQALHYLEGTGPYSERAKFPLPNLVFLDLRLPGMDGLKVLEWVRSHPRFQGLPVVVISGSQAEADISKAYALYANSYLTKTPLLENPQTLEAVLRYWLETNQFPPPNPPQPQS